MRGSSPAQQPADVLMVADEDQHRHARGEPQAREASTDGRGTSRSGAITATVSAAREEMRKMSAIDDPGQPRRDGPPARRSPGGCRRSTPRPCRRESPARPETGGRETRRHRPAPRLSVRRQRRRQHHRRRALGGVADQGDRRQVAAAGAQHIGRPDVAGADLAHVAGSTQPGGDHSKWDRAQQIATCQAGPAMSCP